MAEYISSFTTGFGEIIAQKLLFILRGVEIIRVYDGLICYKYNGDCDNINKIVFFNNSYCVIKFFEGNYISFSKMVSAVVSEKYHYLKTDGTFRIRFSRSNQFVKVEKQIVSKAEISVIKSTRLKIDRLNPTTELWYIIRDEGFGFYGQLLKKRTTTEKNLNKGELRPEIANLMCCCIDYSENSVILDPFAGFGAIPLQIKKHFRFRQLIVMDNDMEKVEKLKRVFQCDDSKVQVVCNNALKQTSIESGSIDFIVTDPPWGYYDNIPDIYSFYCEMLNEFQRIVKTGGKVVVLSARKDEFTKAVSSTSGFLIGGAIHTLVNGKKAAVFILHSSAHVANKE